MGIVTPEGKVKIKIDRWIKENMPNAFKYKAPGGLFGQAGVGDYLIVYCGTPVMIEVKADITKKPTDLQMYRLEKFKNANGIAAVLKGFEEHKLVAIKRMCELRRLREVLNTPNSGDFSGSDEYSIWYRTRQKCTNQDFSGYEVYGAIGIKMCDRWLNDFKAFYADLGPRPTLLHTLDRIDPVGNYEPANCRWADKTVQANNKQNIKKYTYKGFTGSLSELARLFSKHDPETVIARVLTNGWSLEEAIEEPIKKKLVIYKGVEKTLGDWCRELNLNHKKISGRLAMGWTVEKAFETL